MPALPPSTDFTDSNVQESQFKTAMTNLRGYLNGLFGSGGASLENNIVFDGDITINAGNDLKLGNAVSDSFIYFKNSGASAVRTLSMRYTDGGADILTIDVNGNATFTGNIIAAAGTVLLPSMTTSGDPDTGGWFPEANIYAISTGGMEAFRINPTQKIIIGYTVNLPIASQGGDIQIHTNAANRSVIGISHWEASATAVPSINLGKSRSGTVGTFSTVVTGDYLGSIQFAGDDGTNFAKRAAQILVSCEGTIAGGQIPGVLKISTANSSGTLTTALTLDSSQNLVIGTAALATTATDGFLYITTCAGTPTGVPTSYTGRLPIVYDSTNNKLYLYDGSWLGITLT